MSAVIDRLERDHVAVYLAAVGLGVLIGVVAPGTDGLFEALIYPALGVMLYATFISAGPQSYCRGGGCCVSSSLDGASFAEHECCDECHAASER